MERPFFSLAKKPRRTPIAYDVNGTKVTVYPVKEFGIATIWDADILPAPRLSGTPCKRKRSAGRVDDDGRDDGLGRGRPRAGRADVPAAQGSRRAAAVAWRGLETVSRALGVTAATLSGWRDAFLAAGEAILATRPGPAPARSWRANGSRPSSARR
jgi:hypothetical protein